MENLPIIVNTTGDYRLRNGKRVTVHEIRKGTSFFEVKGSIWKTTEKMGNNPEYDIWHVSGRHNVFGEVGRDIVAEWY